MIWLAVFILCVALLLMPIVGGVGYMVVKKYFDYQAALRSKELEFWATLSGELLAEYKKIKGEEDNG